MRSIRAAGSALALLLAVPAVHACDQQPSLETNPLDHLPTWTVERDLEIGHEGDRDYALTPVGGLAISPRGDIFVSQPQDRHIRVFNRNGEFQRTIGRRGEGPGEFVRLGEIGFLGDTLWAVDVRSVAFLHYLSEDGQPLRLRRLPNPEPPYLGGANYYPLADGGVLIPTATSGDLINSDHEQPWQRWDAADSLVGWLPGYAATGAAMLENTTVFAGRPIFDSIPVIRPLSTKSWVDIAPDASVITRADYNGASDLQAEVRLARYTPTGDTIAYASYKVRRELVPLEVADSLREAQVARVGAAMRNEPKARRALADVFEMPSHYPPIRSVFVDSDSRSWLELEAQPNWLIVGPDLWPISWVSLPRSFRPYATDGSELWGIELDQLDVPRVVRFSIRSSE